MKSPHWGTIILVALAVFVVVWVSKMSKGAPYWQSPGTPATPVLVNPYMPTSYPGPAGPFGSGGLSSAMRSPFEDKLGMGYAP